MLIENFRGIKRLDWTLPTNQRLFALVGPGDTGKSTILDAIYYLLGDRWNTPFADTDFFGTNLDDAIRIRAVVTDLPRTLLRDTAFGFWLSGVDEDGAIYQEPEDSLEPALVVSLTVDSSLEPRWAVTRVDGTEQVLTSSQRRSFGVFRVDDRTDAQLRWSRTSPLGRMSAEDGGEREALAAASRAAREALSQVENDSLVSIAMSVQEKANQIGGGGFSRIRPGLDVSRSSMGAGLALYEDVVPLTAYGLGSRRLASLAVQQVATGSRSIVLVDELESGLEPHRAIRLLNYLKSDDDYLQVIVTTHSPTLVEQAQVESLVIVQNEGGQAIATCLGGATPVTERIRRGRPSSLLARRVVVVEGKTELGLILECLDLWDSERAEAGLPTAAGMGVAVQDGNGGSEVGPRGEALASLGISVLGFLDNDDRTVDTAVASAQAAGVEMVRWELGMNTEAQVCSQLSAQGLTRFLELAVEIRSSCATVLQDLEAADTTFSFDSLDVEDWLEHGDSVELARARVARAAVERRWFKGVDDGRALGRWIINHAPTDDLASTHESLGRVQLFAYGRGSVAQEGGPSQEDSDG